MANTVIAHVGGVFALLTLVHFVADWVFQSHAEAMAKPTHHKVRAKHCLIYTALCLVAIWASMEASWPKLLAIAALLFFSHFFEDTYLPVYVWARYIRKPLEMEARATMVEFAAFASTALGKILLIAIDQIVHILFLVPVAVILVVPEYWGLAALAGSASLLGLGALCVFGSGRVKEP